MNMEYLELINEYIGYAYLVVAIILLIVFIIIRSHLKKLNKSINYINLKTDEINKIIEESKCKLDISTKAISGTFNNLIKIYSSYIMIKFLMKKENRIKDKKIRDYEKFKSATRRVIG